MTTDAETMLDGNSAAGVLREVFAVDVTAATGECAGCGQAGPMGGTHVYPHAPGLVVRCANCEAVLIRMVIGSGRTWLDLRGLRYLEFATPDAS